jgi:hypothetical protein
MEDEIEIRVLVFRTFIRFLHVKNGFGFGRVVYYLLSTSNRISI